MAELASTSEIQMMFFLIYQGSLTWGSWSSFGIKDLLNGMQNWEDAYFSIRRQCFHLILKGVCDLNKIKDHCDTRFPTEPGELVGRAVSEATDL